MSAVRKSKSPAPDTRVLPISSILRLPKYQFRPLDHGFVRRYASAMRVEEELPPVQIAELNGAYILVDGWHRVAAAESIGRKEIAATVEPVASEEEALWLAAKANVKHGLPLKAKEFRSVFRAYVSAKRHRLPGGGFKSYRDIAAELGGAKSFTTIRNWMEKDYPPIFRAMGGAEPFERQEPTEAVSPEAGLVAAVYDALQTARAAMQGVTDEYLRGEVVSAIEGLLSEAQQAAWKIREYDSTDF